MTGLLLVMAGGGLGAGLRYGLNLGAARAFGLSFPWGTLACNVLGSLAMGLLIGAMTHGLFGLDKQSQELRLFLGVGLLGGFTTFSTFSLDAIALWQRGDSAAAAGYMAASVTLALGGLLVGMRLARGF